MTYRSTQDARCALAQIAASQGGYLTAKQAATVGYWKRHLDDHVKTGNVERIQRGLSGVYRTFIKPLCKSFQPR